MRIAGMIQIAVDGTVYSATGNWTYNLGSPKREEVLSTTTFVGVSEMPQAAFLEGEIIDASSLDLAAFLEAEDVQVTCTLGNGKVLMFPNATQVGEGTGNTEKANINVKFVCAKGEEVL